VARSGRAIRVTLLAELTAPSIQLLTLLFMLVGFSTSVAPQLAQSIPMSAMDDSQRTLFVLADLIATTWWFLVPMLVGLAGLSLWSLPRYCGVMRPYLDRIPPWSVYKVYSAVTFMISMSALIKSGVPIESAIRFIKTQSSPWLADHLSVMVGRLRSGVEQGEAMDTGLLPPRVADMVAIYSRTADFDAAIFSVGRMAMDDGLASIKAKASLAKTASTIAIGAMVAWIFLSMLAISDAAVRAGNQTNQVVTPGRR
jgi:type II secretory pathway component PulF